MSLINDALKRAKLAQQQASATPAPALQLRPLEPVSSPAAWRLPGLLLPVAMAGVALFALLFVWQLFHKTSSPGVVEAKARTPLAERKPAAPAVAAHVEPAAPFVPAAAQVVVQQKPPAQPAPAPLPGPAALETKPTTDVTVAAAPVDTAPLVTDVPQPEPPALRLQAIIFNPRRPSALISGRTVFLGDKYGNQRVIRITRNSATLAGGGQTNVLSLPE